MISRTAMKSSNDGGLSELFQRIGGISLEELQRTVRDGSAQPANVQESDSRLISMPGEIITDAFCPLERVHLDALQITCRRFRSIVDVKMRNKCLRYVQRASVLWANSKFSRKFEAVTEAGVKIVHAGNLDQVTDFMARALMNSTIAYLVLGDLSLTVPFCEKFREAAPTIRVDEFKIFNSNFSTVDTDVFHDLIRSFMYVNELLLIGSARADQVTDGFLKDCATIGVSHLELPSSKPVDAEYYQVTEEGIISFCFDSNRPGDRRLTISHPRITSNFFSALVEAHQNSTVTADLKLSVRAASGQNVSAYAHLMRRVMGADGAADCYDFEGPVHMQICVQEDELVLRRGKFRADGWFIRV